MSSFRNEGIVVGFWVYVKETGWWWEGLLPSWSPLLRGLRPAAPQAFSPSLESAMRSSSFRVRLALRLHSPAFVRRIPRGDGPLWQAPKVRSPGPGMPLVFARAARLARTVEARLPVRSSTAARKKTYRLAFPVPGSERPSWIVKHTSPSHPLNFLDGLVNDLRRRLTWALRTVGRDNGAVLWRPGSTVTQYLPNGEYRPSRRVLHRLRPF